MNTDYYKVFLKVVETKNISKAAQLLGYTQSGVSHIIGKLEKELQMTLLLRERTGITITHQAQPLIPLMESLLECEKQIFQEAAEQSGKQGISIRLVTLHSIAVSWLPQMLQDFLEIHPDVHFEITEKNSYPELEHLIADRNVDCGFSVEISNPRIEFTPIFQDDYYVVMPLGHPLEAFSRITPKQLKDYSFILPEDWVTHRNLEEVIKGLDVKRNLTTNPLDDLMTLSLVEQGWGISIVPCLVKDSSISRISSRKLKGSYYRRIGLGIAKGVKPSPALKAFLEFVPTWLADMKK